MFATKLSKQQLRPTFNNKRWTLQHIHPRTKIHGLGAKLIGHVARPLEPIVRERSKWRNHVIDITKFHWLNIYHVVVPHKKQLQHELNANENATLLFLTPCHFHTLHGFSITKRFAPGVNGCNDATSCKQQL